MTSPRTRLAILLAAAALGGCAVVPAYDYGPSYGYDQPPVQRAIQPVPDKADGPQHRFLSEAKRMSPAVVRPELPARPAEAVPQRRGGDEARHTGRRGPDDGEPRDRH